MEGGDGLEQRIHRFKLFVFGILHALKAKAHRNTKEREKTHEEISRSVLENRERERETDHVGRNGSRRDSKSNGFHRYLIQNLIFSFMIRS